MCVMYVQGGMHEQQYTGHENLPMIQHSTLAEISNHGSTVCHPVFLKALCGMLSEYMPQLCSFC